MEKKYLEQAKKLIEKRDPIIYDVASNLFPAQIVGNVKHMSFFQKAVAEWIKKNKQMRKVV